MILLVSSKSVRGEARPERLLGGRQEADRRGVLVRGAQAAGADIAAEAPAGVGGEVGTVRGGDAADLAEDGRGQDDDLGLLQRQQQEKGRGELSGGRTWSLFLFMSSLRIGFLSYTSN